MEKTRGQKAAATRRKHDEAIKAKREAEAKRKQAAVDAMEAVLKNADATPAEKVEAARLLLEWSKLR